MCVADRTNDVLRPPYQVLGFFGKLRFNILVLAICFLGINQKKHTRLLLGVLKTDVEGSVSQ